MTSIAPEQRQAKERRRYSPEKRRELILDQTAEIVARDGIAMLSIEQISREAGVSKSLVYAYFPNLTELLRELYQREMRQLRKRQSAAAENAESVEQLVRSITHAYLGYIDERGLIIERLQGEPSVSENHDPTDFDRDVAVDYLTDVILRFYKLPRTIARAATDISFGLPASAGSYLHRHDLDLKTLEDLTVTMIIGTFSNLENRFGGTVES
jgi:TetR/AcrR family transcriptional regulator, fatty acid biosynthesis regulator